MTSEKIVLEPYDGSAESFFGFQQNYLDVASKLGEWHGGLLSFILTDTVWYQLFPGFIKAMAPAEPGAPPQLNAVTPTALSMQLYNALLAEHKQKTEARSKYVTLCNAFYAALWASLDPVLRQDINDSDSRFSKSLSQLHLTLIQLRGVPSAHVIGAIRLSMADPYIVGPRVRDHISKIRKSAAQLTAANIHVAPDELVRGLRSSLDSSGSFAMAIAHWQSVYPTPATQTFATLATAIQLADDNAPLTATAGNRAAAVSEVVLPEVAAAAVPAPVPSPSPSRTFNRSYSDRRRPARPDTFWCPTHGYNPSHGKAQCPRPNKYQHDLPVLQKAPPR
jgi:hypothetical protein